MAHVYVSLCVSLRVFQFSFHLDHTKIDPTACHVTTVKQWFKGNTAVKEMTSAPFILHNHMSPTFCQLQMKPFYSR